MRTVISGTKSGIKNYSLAVAPDGALQCTSLEGKPCSDAEVQELAQGIGNVKIGLGKQVELK